MSAFDAPGCSTNTCRAGTPKARARAADHALTRGTFKGQTASKLDVSVEGTAADALPTLDAALLEVTWAAEAAAASDEERKREMQQQQQQ